MIHYKFLAIFISLQGVPSPITLTVKLRTQTPRIMFLDLDRLWWNSLYIYVVFIAVLLFLFHVRTNFRSDVLKLVNYYSHNHTSLPLHKISQITQLLCNSLFFFLLSRDRISCGRSSSFLLDYGLGTIRLSRILFLCRLAAP